MKIKTNSRSTQVPSLLPLLLGLFFFAVIYVNHHYRWPLYKKGVNLIHSLQAY